MKVAHVRLRIVYDERFVHPKLWSWADILKSSVVADLKFESVVVTNKNKNQK